VNNRIKELAEQSMGTRKHIPPVWQFFDDELQKFAELIIRECADIASINAHSWTPPGVFVLKHFGVEE
jgi:hypothetical protein